MTAASRLPRLVSAGAGTGKTYWIVEHVCARVFAGTPLERIAAVTFTEAAAAELQDRIRARLLASPEYAPLAARVDAAAVCTIHSFALALLRRYPLAAGVPPDALTLEPAHGRALLRAHTADLLRDADGGPLRELLDRGLGPGLGLAARGFRDDDTPTGRLAALVEQVVEKSRSLGLAADALTAEGARAAARLDAALGPAGDPTALGARFERALAAALAFVGENPAPPTKSDERLYAVLRAVVAGPDAADAAAPPSSREPWLETAVRIAALGPDAYGKRKFTAAEELCVAAAAVACDHPDVRARLAATVRGVFDATARVLAAYEADKTRIGALDFEDMQLAAWDLLTGRGPAGVPYAPLVARALPLVVVDEFQDTSPLQYVLFETLRAAGAEVVYVGDVKQGIYGFRTADSALFGALLERAAADGRGHEELAASRRSRPELVAFANELFGAALPSAGVPYAPLGVANAYAAGAAPREDPCVDVVRHALTPKSARHAAVIDRLAALVGAGAGEAGCAAPAPGISRLTVLDRATGAPRPARWGDVAILAWKNGTLADWSRALRARGVGTVLDEGRLFDALEVELALAWLRMLASPRDRAAAAGVLLSELYGVRQETMVRLTLAGVVGAPARALEVAARDGAALPLTAFERRALARCAADLSLCRRALRHLPLAEAVEFALERVDLGLRLALKLGPADARRMRANLRRVVEFAHDLAERAERPLALDGATGITLENLLIAFDRARDAGAPQPALEDTDAAVRLATIHSAKGLEYSIVVLDALDNDLEVRLPRVEVARPDDPDVLLGPDALAASGVVLVPDVGIPALRDRLAPLFDSARAQRREWLRLLYVAVTRAREHLVLLWPEDAKSKTAAPRVKSLLLDTVAAPPAAAGEAAWVLRPGGAEHRVHVVHAASSAERGGETSPPGDDDDASSSDVFAALRAMVDRPDGEWPEPDAIAESGAGRPRLSVVSPTELCRVADCPEVPRLAVVHPGEHALARFRAEAVELATVASAATERAALGDALDPAQLGRLLHHVLERADLAAPGDPAADRAAAQTVLARRGVDDPGLLAFVSRAVASVREALAHLGAVEIVAREAPFVLDVGGVAVRGAVDLIARSSRGLHVVDLKSHALPADAVPRWAGYYRPQLDAYALALATITGEPIAGRHLVLPSAGLVATLADAFDPSAAAARLAAWADALAAETPGPGPANDCARCGWRAKCPRAPAFEGDLAART